MWHLSYRLLRTVSAVGRWFGHRLSPAGSLALGAMIVAGALGIDTRQTLAYQLFAFIAALMTIGWLCSAGLRPRFEVRREAPRNVTAGQPFSYPVTVRNAGRHRADALTLMEITADPRPSFDQFRSRLRFPSYRGWWRLIMQAMPVQFDEAYVPSIEAGGEARVTVHGYAWRRGTAVLEGLGVAREEPLGLFRRRCLIQCPARLVVLPKRYDLPPILLPGARRYQQGGVSLAASVGDSEEFASLRDYRPGDPLQRIHWKSFARTGDPVVREYQDEFFERHALLLDTFAPPGPAFEEAVSVAASFAFTLDARDCLLDLVFVGAEPYRFTAGRGQLSGTRLIEILAGVRPCEGEPFERLAQSVLGRQEALSGCILVLLAWDEARRELVQRLHASGVPLIVLAVLDERPAQAPSWLHTLKPGRVQQDLAAL